MLQEYSTLKTLAQILVFLWYRWNARTFFPMLFFMPNHLLNVPFLVVLGCFTVDTLSPILRYVVLPMSCYACWGIDSSSTSVNVKWFCRVQFSRWGNYLGQRNTFKVQVFLFDMRTLSFCILLCNCLIC